MKTISLDLMEFIETQILPRYNDFDKAHNLGHANSVIAHSVELATALGADVDMAYAIAAYHDLGMSGPRAIHHITGGKILATDARLRRWFSPQQILIMQQAVEDHRASAAHEPRSIYGKIVAEADRDLQPDTVFRRTVQYGLSHYPHLDLEQQWQRFQQHMHDKYSTTGYIRLWIPQSRNHEYLRQIREIIDNPAQLRQWFDKCYEEEKTLSTPSHE